MTRLLKIKRYIVNSFTYVSFLENVLIFCFFKQQDDQDEMEFAQSHAIPRKVNPSGDEIIPEPKVKIKPRMISKDTLQTPTDVDFFARKPHIGPEAWKDALEMWEGLFHSGDIDNLPRKTQHLALKLAIKDVEKFKGDERFDQQLLQQWEQEFMDRMKTLELVSPKNENLFFTDLII
jgi:hypothetical protein